MSGESPLERELQIHLQLTQWEEHDLHAVAMAIHAVGCQSTSCRHGFGDISADDLARARAAITTLRTLDHRSDPI